MTDLSRIIHYLNIKNKEMYCYKRHRHVCGQLGGPVTRCVSIRKSSWPTSVETVFFFITQLGFNNMEQKQV